MKKTVLLYHFDKEEERAAKTKLLPLKFSVHAVSAEEYRTPIGVLCGADEAEPDSSSDTVLEFGKLAVMCGVVGDDVDKVLAALRKAGFGRDVLKAVMTPTNRTWSGAQLYSEIYKEHLMMTKPQ